MSDAAGAALGAALTAHGKAAVAMVDRFESAAAIDALLGGVAASGATLEELDIRNDARRGGRRRAAAAARRLGGAPRQPAR